MNRPEVIEDRVRRGFDLFDGLSPGWYRRVPDPKSATVNTVLRTIGDGRARAAISNKVGKGASQLDMWMFGLAAEPAWVKRQYLDKEWRRQIQHALATGAPLQPQRPADELLECVLCGAPRWDNESIRRVEGKPVCDPYCPVP